MSKFVIAGLIWRCLEFKKDGFMASDFEKVKDFVEKKITKLSSKYGIANSLTVAQIEDTSYDFWEALFNQDGVFLRNVRAKYYNSNKDKYPKIDDSYLLFSIFPILKYQVIIIIIINHFIIIF